MAGRILIVSHSSEYLRLSYSMRQVRRWEPIRLIQVKSGDRLQDLIARNMIDCEIKTERSNKANMQIKEIDSYSKHGCCIRPAPGQRLAMIEYWSDVEHGFNGAYGRAGLLEKLKTAKELATAREIAAKLPGYSERLAIPDLVFCFTPQD
jgi:hypothetical protein